MKNEDRPGQDPKQDDVGTLLRLAGKREPVPQERFERVRAAAQEKWRSEVGSRTRRRQVRTVVGLLAAASLITMMVLILLPRDGGEFSGAEALIRVEALTGLAQVRERSAGSRSTFRRASVGDTITVGAEFATVADGRAALRLASGFSLRLDVATRVRWLGRSSFALDRGAVYVDTGPEADSRRHVEIRTPLGSVHDIGTQFEVRSIGDSIRIRLREGSVVLHRKAEVHDVEAGNELTVASDGSVTRRSISPSGSEWDWVAAITPMLDLEGRSARTFLEWIARERGWALRFTDDELAASAGEIRLDGSFSRLSVDDALDAVLPACRMAYRVEQGTLVVSAATGS